MTTSRLLLAAALGVSLGCAGRQSGRALVAAAANPSEYQPPNAVAGRTVRLLGRSVVRTSGADPYRVTFDDPLVQPSTSSVPISLAQAAVVEVRSGEGQATVAERRLDLKEGMTFAVAPEERLSIQPRGGPVELRVVQISSR